MASFHELQSRGNSRPLSAVDAKNEARDSVTGHFQFGRRNGILGYDVRNLLLRLLSDVYDQFAPLEGGSLFTPTLAKSLLDLIYVHRDSDVIKYSDFARCFRSLFHIRSLLGTANKLLQQYTQHCCAGGKVKLPTSDVGTNASGMFGLTFLHPRNGQRYVGLPQAVKFLADLMGADTGSIILRYQFHLFIICK